MQKDRKEKHICRLCNKSFSSGKVLGGHMRGHSAASTNKEDAEHGNSSMGFQGGYGLRENPKKSWKISSFNPISTTATSITMQENTCKVCGKKFESLRAVFGHMRHHSGKDRKGINCRECGEGFQSLRALTDHMSSHPLKLGASSEPGTSSSDLLVVESLTENETANPTRRKRSRRMRYKTTPTSSFSSLNEPSFVSEIEQEVQEVALCLMMMSGGLHSWSDSSVTDSPDNNCLTFEVKSSNQNKQIVKDESNFVCGGDQSLNIKRPREKLDSCASDAFDALCENNINKFTEFDSGLAHDEEKMPEFGVPVKKIWTLNMPKVDDESKFLFCDDAMKKEIHVGMKIKSDGLDLDEDLIKEDVGGFKSVKSSSCRDVGFDACGADLCGNNSDSEILDNSQKKIEFRCRTCNKVYHSYQALGGHQTLHRINKSCILSKTENYIENVQPDILPEYEADCKLAKPEAIANSVGQETGSITVKVFEHKCPICFKIFMSGQALGGHKRVHHTRTYKSKTKAVALKQEFSGVSDVIDLNLPSMLRKEATSDAVFKALWIGSDHKHDELVGMVAS